MWTGGLLTKAGYLTYLGSPHLHVNRPLALEKPVEKTVQVVQTNVLGSTFNAL